jgi:hypothetical protein
MDNISNLCQSTYKPTQLEKLLLRNNLQGIIEIEIQALNMRWIFYGNVSDNRLVEFGATFTTRRRVCVWNYIEAYKFSGGACCPQTFTLSP